MYSNAALHWVTDHARLLQHVYLALKPAGILRFNFGGDGNCAHFLQVIKETMALAEYCHAFAEFTWPWYMPKVCEYKVLLEKFPLKEVKVWEEQADQYFMTADEMVNWIDQPCLVPFLKQVDAARRQDFRHTVVANMLKRTRQQMAHILNLFGALT